MKRLTSFFLSCLRNKISDIDLRFNYLPYEKFIGILDYETGMYFHFPKSECEVWVTSGQYYSELMMVLNKKGLIKLYRKGKSGSLELVDFYKPHKLYEDIKNWYVNRKQFFKMIENQKALDEENRKIISRMNVLEKDVELVHKYKNLMDIEYKKREEEYTTVKRKDSRSGDTFSAKSDDPKKDSLLLEEYIGLKERAKQLSKELFLNFTQYK